MKHLIITLVVMLALAAGFATKASASTASYVCKYKAIGAAVYVKMDGPANRPAYCQSLAKGWASRFYGVTPGSRRCTYRMDSQAAYLHLYTRSATIGSYFCDNLEDMLTSWVRIY